MVGICVELHTFVYMKGVNGTCLDSRDPFPDIIMEWPSCECREINFFP